MRIRPRCPIWLFQTAFISVFSPKFGVISPPSGEQYFHLVGVNSPLPSFTRGLNCGFIVFLASWLNKAWVSLLPSFSGLLLSVQREFSDPFPWEQGSTLLRPGVTESLKISCEKLTVTHNRLQLQPSWPPPPVLTRCLLNCRWVRFTWRMSDSVGLE